jgi:hypothetical protein
MYYIQTITPCFQKQLIYKQIFVYTSTKASGYLHEKADVCVWLLNGIVGQLVPFLATQQLSLVGIHLKRLRDILRENYVKKMEKNFL